MFVSIRTMEEGDRPRDMPMHYAYFTKNEECSLP